MSAYRLLRCARRRKSPSAHARQRRPTLVPPSALAYQREALRQFTEHLLAQGILVFEDQILHLPELPARCSKLSGFGSGLSIGMDFSQREISKREPQLFSEPLLERFDDRVCTSTVRTFVVAIFDQRHRSVGGTLGVIVRTDRHFQLCHNGLISEDSPELRESRRPQG